MTTPKAYPLTETEVTRLVAGPYMWHHKMDDAAEREAKAFDRCRELTIQNIKVHFATLAAAQHPGGTHDRESLGKMVRAVWIDWAREQPAPKSSWLAPWEELAEPDREVDRRIGEKLFKLGEHIGRFAPEPESAAPAVSDEAVEAAIQAYDDYCGERPRRPTMRVALAAAFPKLTAQVASLVARLNEARDACAVWIGEFNAASERAEAAEQQCERLNKAVLHNYEMWVAAENQLAVAKQEAERFEHLYLFECTKREEYLDRLAASEADAARYQWLCDGNGYFMEENMLCGDDNDKAEADAAIDAARAATKE